MTRNTSRFAGWVLGLALVAGHLQAAPGEGNGDRVPPSRDLNQFVTTETGMITLSADGIGTMASSALLRVEKPSAGATVRVAYLAAASTGFLGYVIPNGDIQLAGTPVSWAHSIPNGILSWNHLGDVTSVVAPLIDPLGAGIHTIPVTEFHSSMVDGTALYVVFDDPATFTTRTAVIAFGAQATGGDSFSIGFGQPVFPDANTVVEFGLAISYGYARGTCQTSYIDVNGQRLTSSAGGDDEGVDQNGALITVGGVGDSRSNPVNPMFNDPCSWTDFTDYDDELYNIAGYIAPGSTSMTVNTFNPSADDNIFVAHLLLDFAAVVGEGGVLTPAQTAVCVGDPVTLTLSLQDGLGNPLVGHPATATITSGPNAGQVFSGTTDALGRLDATWTGLTVGVDHIVGSFTDSNGIPRQTNESTVAWQLCQAEESGSLSPSTATRCTGESHTVTLALQDANGNPLVNYPASILVMAGPHAGRTANGFSNPAGLFSMTWTGTFPGTDVIRGSFLNSSGIQENTATVEVHWQVCAQPETGVLTPATATLCLGEPHTVTLAMQDLDGIPVEGHPVTIEILAGPHAGLTASGPTDVNGEFLFSYIGELTGTDTIEASWVGSDGIPVSSNEITCTWEGCYSGGWGEVTPVFSSGCLGDEFTFTLTLRGGFGNPLINYPVTLEVFEGPNTGVSVSGNTDINGQISLSYTSSVVGNDKLRGLFLDEFLEERESDEAEREWVECFLPAPVITLVDSSPCNARITWTPVPGASSYDVWVSDGLGGPWVQETNTANPFYSIGCVGPTDLRLFRVTASTN